MTFKVGFFGLGKLGLPVAASMALRGADVMGFDLNKDRMTYAPQPYQEAGPEGTGDFNDVLPVFCTGGPRTVIWGNGTCTTLGHLNFRSVEDVCSHADIIFVAVQTPHDPRYEGITTLSGTTQDFDYSYLVSAITQLVPHISKPTPVVVISTVLPGTMDRHIKPILKENPNMRLVYNPAFIAMGTTMRDFLQPEFVLLGVDDVEAAHIVEDFYNAILPHADIRMMSVPSAELTKVAYNTFISCKIMLANTIMEICSHIPGANCDSVSQALEHATVRITGPAYMRGGMGDGGGCHPRDNIALGWLAKELGLSADPFTFSMQARESQTRWLAKLVWKFSLWERESSRMSAVIAGYGYKPGTNITTGSPALLLRHILTTEHNIKCSLWDPHVCPEIDKWPLHLEEPSVVVLGCLHKEFASVNWEEALPPGSVLIDPFRVVPHDLSRIKVVRLGEGSL